ncbi:hypothetical protein BB427_00695 [Pseudoalteromonas sp. BMB]|nr:hypothetical protein [Pseudoalteromonas sp. BMB]ODB44941.1 hypothetical protein BB427_00695 [Pseudoalteromonas sp. BMB]
MSSKYNGIQFGTDLEAIWAAFFDLAGWEWRSNPAAIEDWKPDFKVTFKCEHSECGGSHTLLVSVLPVKSLNNLEAHPALSHVYGVSGSDADGGALFGSSPLATKWVIAHGSGGGSESIYDRVENADELWARAVVVTTPN